ncbi:hypothetical protein CEXT_411011 [Caerostris extrusa]|uniref:Uncharacterized protein n=1 Tax=Caerostris extrusa TaxID=172846 RepID=A0AAV4SV99_CAEEX|nr:hypothetical protein CEXT_411011 [Caerostris extrusa]
MNIGRQVSELPYSSMFVHIEGKTQDLCVGDSKHWMTISCRVRPRDVVQIPGTTSTSTQKRVVQRFGKDEGSISMFGEYVKLKGFDDRSIDYVQKAIGGMVFDAEMEKYAKNH